MSEQGEHLEEPAPHKTVAEIRADVELIADGRGNPIDEGIKDTVVGLMANGVSTMQSCEGGHEGRGLSYPWVEISNPPPDGMDNDESGLQKQQWIESNKQVQRKLDNLLGEFYADRETEIRVGYDSADQNGGIAFRPVPRPIKEQPRLAEYRAEMNAFAQFCIAKAEQSEGRVDVRPNDDNELV